MPVVKTQWSEMRTYSEEASKLLSRAVGRVDRMSILAAAAAIAFGKRSEYRA